MCPQEIYMKIEVQEWEEPEGGLMCVQVQIDKVLL